MDHIGVFIGILLIALQVTGFIWAVKSRTFRQRCTLIGIELLAVLGNVGIAYRYDQLPGKGKAPGLTYFADTVIAMGLTVVGIILLVSTITAVFIRSRER